MDNPRNGKICSPHPLQLHADADPFIRRPLNEICGNSSQDLRNRIEKSSKSRKKSGKFVGVDLIYAKESRNRDTFRSHN